MLDDNDDETFQIKAKGKRVRKTVKYIMNDEGELEDDGDGDFDISDVEEEEEYADDDLTCI